MLGDTHQNNSFTPERYEGWHEVRVEKTGDELEKELEGILEFNYIDSINDGGILYALYNVYAANDDDKDFLDDVVKKVGGFIK